MLTPTKQNSSLINTVIDGIMLPTIKFLKILLYGIIKIRICGKYCMNKQSYYSQTGTVVWRNSSEFPFLSRKGIFFCELNAWTKFCPPGLHQMLPWKRQMGGTHNVDSARSVLYELYPFCPLQSQHILAQALNSSLSKLWLRYQWHYLI